MALLTKNNTKVSLGMKSLERTTTHGGVLLYSYSISAEETPPKEIFPECDSHFAMSGKAQLSLS